MKRGVLICAVVLLATAAVGFLYSKGAHLSGTSPVAVVNSRSQIASPEGALSSASSSSAVASTTIATTTSTKATKSSAIPVGATPLPSPTQPVVSAQVQQTRNLSASGAQLLKSLVNIVCISSDPSIPSISGTGVMIDPRGIILTAAHVAQPFLLEDYLGSSRVTCLIRTGSPARRAYFAKPIYVSKTWVANNPTTLSEKNPKGTGENDVALLAVTDTATSTPLPSTFPYMPLATRDPVSSDRFAIGSYGAQYLTSLELNLSLYPILIFGDVKGRYTYGSGTVDVVTVDGSAASQEGSSGGGIATSDGTLIGTITTSSISGDFATRLLNSVTVGHLRRSFTQDTGKDLDATLSGESINSLIQDFANQSSILGSQLANAIGVN